MSTHGRDKHRYDLMARLMPSMVGACCMFSTCMVFANGHPDDEVAIFRFTDFEGHVALNYRGDKQIISSGASSSTEKRTSFEEEVFLLGHAYMYHPKFLNMDLGIGPVFVQSDYETDAGSSSIDTSEFNLLARLRFLEDKPYPLYLYYEKDYPTVELTLTDTFRQQNEKYGFDFQLKQPLLPFQVSVGASQLKTKGEGFIYRNDDIIDERIVRLDIPTGVDGYTRITYNENDLVSNYSYQQQPVQTTKINTDTTTLDSRIYLGDKNEFQLSNLLSHVKQEFARSYEEIRYDPELRWTHSKDLESYYRLHYLNNDQVTVETTNYGAETGFRYTVSDMTNVDAEIHAVSEETTGLTQENYGISGHATHNRLYSFGELNLSGGWSYNLYDRVAPSSVPITNLELDMVGTIPQFLPQNNIILSTIVATRVADNTILTNVGSVCGADPNSFIAITIDARTQVQLCNVPAGDIIRVSFDYEYDPGGTVAYSSLIQTYQANLRLYEYSNFYVKFQDRSSDVISGTPTVPLDESRNTQFGARFDYPIYESLSLGGELVYEEENGTTFSFKRDSIDAYVEFGVFNGTARVSSRRVTVDYLNSDEDIDLTRYALRFRIRPWNRFSLTADISDQEDTGGSTYQHIWIESLVLEWRVRKLILLGEARRTEEEYGATNRDRSIVKISLRREF